MPLRRGSTALLLAALVVCGARASAEPTERPLAPLAASPRAITDAASEVLLRAAAAALARGDDAEGTRLLRGWASLGAREREVPPVLAARATEAIGWASERGGFGVFASRTSERVTVGVRDPAELLLRVDAWVDDAGELRRVMRGEDRHVDRRDYPFGEARLHTAVVVIDAVGRVAGDEVLLARVVLQPEALLPPPPPDPQRLAGPSTRRDVTPPTERPPFAPWWWVAAGTIAVALAGAGLWQELGR